MAIRQIKSRGARFNFRPCWLVGTLACLGAAMAPHALGAVEAPPTRPATIEGICGDQVQAIEADLAMLLQRRLDATGPQLALVDYQIDLRLLERWMLLRAAEPKTPVDLQACIALRVGNLQSAGDQIARSLQTSTKALLPAQLEGLARLHQLTYKLPPIKNAGAIDEICKSIAPDLILAANPSPAEVKDLPLMRPRPLPPTTQRNAAAPRTLAQLSNRAKEVQVSPALKRQLVSLAGEAEAASVEPKAQEEAAALHDMLATVIDLSDGLEKNTGIDAAARPKMEQQLADGLALYTDPRTRSSGAAHLSALAEYRKTLKRIERLHVSAPLQQKLGPAYVWVNNNPDAGPAVLDAIEKYQQLCTRDESRKEAAPLPPANRKTIDMLHKQFTSQRAGFLEDITHLGSTAGFLATGPSNLKAHVDAMGPLLANIEAIEKLPQAIQALQPLKIKPIGGLERRATAAVVDLGSPSLVTPHEASSRLLADVENLAHLAETLTPPAGISPATLKLYTRERMPAIEARKNAMLSSLASQLASGKELDGADLAKLQTLHDLLDSLRLADGVELALVRSDLLTRWADWSVSPAQLKAMVAPYREGTAAAFAGFADDNATPIFRWDDLRKRFLPVLLLVQELGGYAQQCKEMPTGLPGEFARLLTPMENQPFSTERFVSLSVMLWQASAAAGDQKATDAIFDAMLAGLRKDFRMAE